MKLDGVLFFPITPFTTSGTLDRGLLADHVQSGLPHSPGGIFAACGTGEFHALAVDEVHQVVRTTVDAVSGQVPVFSGAGGPLGHALACAQAAADAGASGLLALPPYLVSSTTSGVVRYFEAIAKASDLPVIVYHRANARLTAEAMKRLAENPKIIGFKDGVGDLATAQGIVLTLSESGREDFLFFNGLLTAEMSQAAFKAIGIPLYSSSTFAMAPEIAAAFYQAYQTDDHQRQQLLLSEFYRPLVELRDQVPGYAVALVKAGVRLGGLPVGNVRAPLVDPTPEHLDRLQAILARGRELVS